MNTAKTYWSPFSPAFRLPLRILGALSLFSAYMAVNSPSHPSILFPIVQGIAFLGVSFVEPKLKTFTKTDIILRRIVSGLLIAVIAALILSIALNLSILPATSR
jgi:hypothetical protein